jgi:hypothetical protein
MEIEFPKSRKIELLANTILKFLEKNKVLLSKY